MFERYTESARRVIFFARHEASEWGSPYIEPEHLVLGLLREARSLLDTLLLPGQGAEDLKRSVEGSLSRREKIPISVDLPMSHSTKRMLAYAAEEAERLANKHIGPEHLLLGILREETSTAAKVLAKYGMSVGDTRQKMAANPILIGRDVLIALRDQFGAYALRLTPEIEPAVIFSLEPRTDE